MILPAVSKYTYIQTVIPKPARQLRNELVEGIRGFLLKKKVKKKVKEKKFDTFSFQTMIVGFLLKTFFPHAFQETNTCMLDYIK